MKKRLIYIVLCMVAALLLGSSDASAQRSRKDRDSVITEMKIKPGVQFDTVTVRQQVHKPQHLLGVRYDFSFSGVSMTPDMSIKSLNSPFNLAVLYTYYQPLWSTLNYFGLQVGVRYTTYGFENDKYQFQNFAQKVTAFELPFLAAFHYDIKDNYRVLLSIGPFAGYRAWTTKDNGWDCFDIRFDYGIQGGLGFAYRLKDFMEFHLEGVFRYSFSMLYYPEKFSSLAWIYTYPWQASICLGIHFRLK